MPNFFCIEPQNDYKMQQFESEEPVSIHLDRCLLEGREQGREQGRRSAGRAEGCGELFLKAAAELSYMI